MEVGKGGPSLGGASDNSASYRQVPWLLSGQTDLSEMLCALKPHNFWRIPSQWLLLFLEAAQKPL